MDQQTNIPQQNGPDQQTPPAITPEPQVVQAPPLPTANPVVQANKSHKKIIIIVSIIVLLILAISSLLLLASLGRMSRETNSTASSELGALSAATLSDYVKDYSSTLSSQYPELTVTDSGIGAVPLHDTASGYFFTTYGKEGWSFNLEKPSESQVVLADTYKTLVSLLETDGFTKYTGKVYTDEWTGDTETTTASYYENNGIVCRARLFEPRVFLSCVEASEVTNEAKKMMPFYTAFFESEEAGDTNVNYSKESVLISVPDEIEKVEKYPEYERVDGGISNNGYGAAIGFFRKNGGEWQFEATKQSAQECNIYNTKDMQKAYYDAPCYINGAPGTQQKNTTVGELYGT